MAVKFHLTDGRETDMVGLSQPVFFVRRLEDFMEMTALRRPDPVTGRVDRGAIEEWVGRHPEAAGAFIHLLTMPAPASYLDLTYHGIHAFELVDVEGTGRFARYRWVPEQPRPALTSEERKAQGPDYLQESVRARLDGGPALFRLEWVLAGPADDVTDPTVLWPDDREVVAGGRLVLGEVAADQDAGCESLVFDPLRLVEGVQGSADPILRARPGAYSVSIEERHG
jgi:catalase